MNKLIIITGTGRCGTTLINELLNKEDSIINYHDPNPIISTFYKWVLFNNLPIDKNEYVNIVNSLTNEQKLSFISSSYYSHSLSILKDNFDLMSLIMIRNPVSTIRSYLAKGWYNDNLFEYADKNSVTGLSNKYDKISHYFNRIVPTNSDKRQNWGKLDRISRLCWYYNEIYSRIIKDIQYKNIPFEILKLEELNYNKYKNIMLKFGLKIQLKDSVFQKIVSGRPNKSKKSTALTLTNKEVQTINEICRPTYENII